MVSIGILPVYVVFGTTTTTMQTLTTPVPSRDIRAGTIERITTARSSGKLSEEQDVVLGLLEEAYQPEVRLSQRDIVRSAGWLGCHRRHEADVVANEFESTTRQVREIIRELRVKHGIPVLSDRNGYFLPSTQAEADSYIARLESEAKARAAASMVTYNAMRSTLGVTSAFFEAIADSERRSYVVAIRSRDGSVANITVSAMNAEDAAKQVLPRIGERTIAEVYPETEKGAE